MSNLKKREDYAFTGIPEGLVVNGDTLPDRGNGENGGILLKAEDIALLSEMVSERLHVLGTDGGIPVDSVISGSNLANLAKQLLDVMPSALNCRGLTDVSAVPSFDGGDEVKWSENVQVENGVVSRRESPVPDLRGTLLGDAASGKINNTVYTQVAVSDNAKQLLESVVNDLGENSNGRGKIDADRIKNLLRTISTMNYAVVNTKTENIGTDDKVVWYSNGDPSSVQPGITAHGGLKSSIVDDGYGKGGYAFTSTRVFARYYTDPFAGSGFWVDGLLGGYKSSSEGSGSSNSTDNVGGKYSSSWSASYGTGVGEGGAAKLVLHNIPTVKLEGKDPVPLVKSATCYAVIADTAGSCSIQEESRTPCPKEGEGIDEVETESSEKVTSQANCMVTILPVKFDKLKEQRDSEGNLTGYSLVSTTSVGSLGLAGGSESDKYDASSSSSPGDSEGCVDASSSSSAELSDSATWLNGWLEIMFYELEPRAKL